MSIFSKIFRKKSKPSDHHSYVDESLDEFTLNEDEFVERVDDEPVYVDRIDDEPATIAPLNNQKAKKSKSVKSTKSATYVVECRIENGSHMFFEICADGDVKQVPEPSGNESVVSCVYPIFGRQDDDTADDYRLSLPKKMASGEASNYLQREMGLLYKLRTTVSLHENVYVAHATNIEKTQKFNNVIPFARVVEILLAQHGKLIPCVAGVLFGDSSLLMLLAYPGNGKVFVQTAISPDNLPEIITSFIASTNILSVEIEDVLLFSGQEFLTTLSSVEAYPKHSDIYGIPFPVVAKYAFIGVCIVAICVDTWYGIEYKKNKDMLHEEEMITAQQSNATNEIVNRMKSNMPAFLSKANINADLFFNHAASLWIPGARVESSAVITGENHRVILPLRAKDKTVNQDQVNDVLHKASIPSNCSIIKSTLSSALSILETDYSCIYPDTFVSTFSAPLHMEDKQ